MSDFLGFKLYVSEAVPPDTVLLVAERQVGVIKGKLAFVTEDEQLLDTIHALMVPEDILNGLAGGDTTSTMSREAERRFEADFKRLFGIAPC